MFVRGLFVGASCNLVRGWRPPTKEDMSPRLSHGLPALLATAGVLLAAPGASQAATVSASPAGKFRDSVGVNTHFNFYDRAYFLTTESVVQTLITDLGVAHVRDGICIQATTNCATANQRLANLYSLYGTGTGDPKVKLNATYAPTTTATTRTDRDNAINAALNAAAAPPLSTNPLIGSLEGTNEADKWAGTGWAAQTVADTSTGAATKASISGISALPHVAPSSGSPNYSATLAGTAGWNTSWINKGNLHPYPGTGIPENAFSSNACNTAHATTPAETASPQIRCAEQVSGSTTTAPKGTWVTETGYTNGSAYCDSRYVSRAASAVYLPRVLLENWRRGIERTYLYELIDNNAAYYTYNDGFGLVSAQLSNNKIVVSGVKPAYNSIKNTLGVIGDLGNASTLGGSLDVTVGTTAAPATNLPITDVRRVLFRKANGSWVLALWRPLAVSKWTNTWPCYSYSDVAVAPLNYRVTINGSTNYTINRFTPGSSASSVQTATGTNTIDIPIGADVTLLTLN